MTHISNHENYILKVWHILSDAAPNWSISTTKIAKNIVVTRPLLAQKYILVTLSTYLNLLSTVF